MHAVIFVMVLINVVQQGIHVVQMEARYPWCIVWHVGCRIIGHCIPSASGAIKKLPLPLHFPPLHFPRFHIHTHSPNRDDELRACSFIANSKHLSLFVLC
jgi:hypothetical protein